MSNDRVDGVSRVTASARSADDRAHDVRTDPWDCLAVISRLEIGPVTIEPRRVIGPYRVTQGERTDQIDLVYRFEEDVFDPKSEEDHNLAGMMLAQVALNYGLFADEILFHGVFDATDRQFLRRMAENTAREITVKKFLEPNPFLIGPAANLPPVVRSRYSRARLRFVGASGFDGESPFGHASKPWGQSLERHAVLSSGGKESLLALGLLRETGRRAYPIFVNESGRHWLTALNGYRFLAAHHPGTSRVWTNSDRVFNWFLRHLPFVRDDFADVRSDEYPIRLWTVAVFLFGALPLLRKHGIGRLSIGDEYDTSRRERFQGIPHYDGLYDQSRYFDDALTEYFGEKGWGVRQFSLLRNLSELLIQRTLAVRYPDLFAHQVSCHAAHLDGSRVRPCGRCEKCRRIVAMLVALGLNPTDCGYTSVQVRDCMTRLVTRGVHQEEPGVRHLAYLLTERGELPVGAPGLPAPACRPEISRLRFDRDRSPAQAIPSDLREQVYRILLQHADGAVRLVNGKWVACDPFVEMGDETHGPSTPDTRTKSI